MIASSYGQIDLHLHLDGSLSARTILNLAKEENITLPADTEEGLCPYITAQMDCKSLNEYLQCFELPLLVLQTGNCLEIAAYELAKDLEAKGLIYAEIRYAPGLHVRKGLDQEGAIRAVLAGLGRAMRESRNGIVLRTILCCMRGADTHATNLETVRLAAEYLGRGVVAVDLAGAEALYPTGDYEEEFTYAKRLGVPFTIHAGEAAGPESIWKALEFGAVRIGHGVRAIEDEELMRELKERGTVLEMCPISNLQTKAIEDIRDYPLRTYLEQGIKVTINSDNMTVSNTWAGKEFEYLFQYYGLTEAEAGLLQENAKAAAFDL